MKCMLSTALFREILLMQEMDADALEQTLLSYMKKQQVSAMRKSAAAKRCHRQRKSWAAFEANLTDRQFRRYFRMPRECFRELCNKIEENVGEAQFKSEAYLRNLKQSTDIRDKKKISIMKCHDKSTGGFISGEVKLALTLRILAGGSYLDLALLFDTSSSHAYAIFHDVIQKWICDNKLVKISGIDYVNDEERLNEVATVFARRSNGLLAGCIGAIDGWLVKIIRPSLKDNVKYPGTFFSRKGFFALNVVAIVDRNKKVVYRVIQSRGAEHDSTAFKHTKLYKWLEENAEKLKDAGFYFIGDSAYSLKSFLLTPYDNVCHGSDEDNYNFFHSASRICVECAFGEIDLRWGILWRRLSFSLAHNIKVVDATMRLHNFIVDYRLAHQVRSGMDELEISLFTDDCRRFLATEMNVGSFGVAGGENEVRRDSEGNISRGGRPRRHDVELTNMGRRIRDALRDKIKSGGHVRPPTNWFRDNNRFMGS